MPDAVFLGHLDGDELARAMASFDIFVHPGESETFGQTLQEAHASGVPIVATGRGGPLDLIRLGIDGWLYRPGDLDDLHMRVADLAGDARKRRAFGVAGRTAVEGRSWHAVCDQLLGHFDEARGLHLVDRGLRAARVRRPEPSRAVGPKRWQRFVALGDSLTEGLCDPRPTTLSAGGQIDSPCCCPRAAASTTPTSPSVRGGSATSMATSSPEHASCDRISCRSSSARTTW